MSGPPASFFSFEERCGMPHTLWLYLLRHVLRKCSRWQFLLCGRTKEVRSNLFLLERNFIIQILWYRYVSGFPQHYTHISLYTGSLVSGTGIYINLSPLINTLLAYTCLLSYKRKFYIDSYSEFKILHQSIAQS